MIFQRPPHFSFHPRPVSSRPRVQSVPPTQGPRNEEIQQWQATCVRAYQALYDMWLYTESQEIRQTLKNTMDRFLEFAKDVKNIGTVSFQEDSYATRLFLLRRLFPSMVGATDADALPWVLETVGTKHVLRVCRGQQTYLPSDRDSNLSRNQEGTVA